MSARVDPNLMSELKEYGAVEIEACFNCGNCTAICPLTSDQYPFPRNMIRLIQLGFDDRLEQSLDPWLCYYCGECSETCPRGAEPAETMMSLRRWLTAKYDWTGLARKFYTSKLWEIGSMVLVGLVVILIALFSHGPVITDQVELNAFAPVEFIHLVDWVMAGGLVFFILTNVVSMHNAILRKGLEVKVPLSLYITEAWSFIVALVTQKRWVDCSEDKDARELLPWIRHLLLVSGYGLMLVLVVFFLGWFQTDEIYPLWHPQRWLGYYATIVILFGCVSAIWGRFKKQIQMHKYSHASDWIFPTLLVAVTLTGIIQHTFRYLGLPLATYYTYVLHLAFAAPMLILEVPFGKWSHLYYRPLAMYFQKIKESALQQELSPEPVPAGD